MEAVNGMTGTMGMTETMGGAVGAVKGAIRDTTGAQVIAKTLDHLNSGGAAAGAHPATQHQLHKDVLAASGIGTRLDTTA